MSESAAVSTFSFFAFSKSGSSCHTFLFAFMYYVLHFFFFFSGKQLVLFSLGLIVSLTGAATVSSEVSRYPLNKTCHYRKQEIRIISIAHSSHPFWTLLNSLSSSDEISLQLIKMFLQYKFLFIQEN